MVTVRTEAIDDTVGSKDTYHCALSSRLHSSVHVCVYVYSPHRLQSSRYHPTYHPAIQITSRFSSSPSSTLSLLSTCSTVVAVRAVISRPTSGMLSSFRVSQSVASQSVLPAIQHVPSAFQRLFHSSAVRRASLRSSPHRSLHSSCAPLLPSLATHSSSSDLSSLSAAYPTVAFQYRPGPLTAAELSQYHRDGFLVKRQFYTEEEMHYLLTIAKSDRELGSAAIDVPDAGGRKSKLTVWNYLSDGVVPDDIYSAIGRGERMVGVMEQLLGDEV